MGAGERRGASGLGWRGGGAALAVVAGLLAAGCGGESPDDPEWVAHAYLSALCDADYGQAHELLAAGDDTPVPTEDEFVATLQRRRDDFGTDDPGCWARSDKTDFEEDGESEGSVEVWRVADSGDGAIRTEVPVVERDDRWYVDVGRLFPLHFQTW